MLVQRTTTLAPIGAMAASTTTPTTTDHVHLQAQSGTQPAEHFAVDAIPILQITATTEPAEADIAEFLVQSAFAALVGVGRFTVAPWFQPQTVRLRAVTALGPGIERHALGLVADRGADADSMVFAPTDHVLASAPAPVARRVCRVCSLLDKELARQEPLSSGCAIGASTCKSWRVNTAIRRRGRCGVP